MKCLYSVLSELREKENDAIKIISIKGRTSNSFDVEVDIRDKSFVVNATIYKAATEEEILTVVKILLGS